MYIYTNVGSRAEQGQLKSLFALSLLLLSGVGSMYDTQTVVATKSWNVFERPWSCGSGHLGVE
jgi:hypothetical protein